MSPKQPIDIPHIEEHKLRELAVHAQCDPRTISKVLRGEPVKGLAGYRARAAIEAAGIMTEGQKRSA